MLYVEERQKGIWPTDIIKDALFAIDEENLNMVSCYAVSEVKIYRQGFEAAINAVVEVLGIEYIPPQADPIQTTNIFDLSV